MLTRAWFALSVIWGILMLIAASNPNANEAGRDWLYAFAVTPFLFGLLVKKIAKYVVTGRL
jgi:hypothetical protein